MFIISCESDQEYWSDFFILYSYNALMQQLSGTKSTSSFSFSASLLISRFRINAKNNRSLHMQGAICLSAIRL